jgi:ABC-2 type transport system permease protein
MLFGIVVLPITFLGGTYYSWSALAPVKLGGWSWLQTLVLLNPLIYVAEGMRAALTDGAHMHLYVVYPVLLGLCAVLLKLGIAGFRRRVLS